MNCWVLSLLCRRADVWQNSKLQSIDAMNSCSQKPVVDEDIDGCKSFSL